MRVNLHRVNQCPGRYWHTARGGVRLQSHIALCEIVLPGDAAGIRGKLPSTGSQVGVWYQFGRVAIFGLRHLSVTHPYFERIGLSDG
jgi:hypothetical protein